MKKVIISEKQRGLLFKNGRFIKILSPGKYRAFGDSEIEMHNASEPLYSAKCDLDTVIADKSALDALTVVEVGDRELALHYINGRFAAALPTGRYAFFKTSARHEFVKVDISDPEVTSDVPTLIFDKIPERLFTRIEVAEHEKARLYFDNKLVRILDAGKYYFWRNGTKVTVSVIDIRARQLNIVGQEVLTHDKVSIRVNIVCSYRVTDYMRVGVDTESFTEELHLTAQLALREYVGRYKLDEILENKDEMSMFVHERLKNREKELYVEIGETGVKDIILPGEIRNIMNTVLVAEKRAQANVITRREEVASTRSLLNTARLMEENKTLYKLKELEYIERICENVGNINLNGSGGVLAQLTGILSDKAQ